MVTKSSIKFIKSLKLKKYRVQEKRYIIEGRKCIEEALKSEIPVEQVIGTEEFCDSLRKQNLLSGIPFEAVNQKTLENLSSFQSNNTGVAIARMVMKERIKERQGPKLVLDGVRDPGNLGTIVRSMDWFGFSNLICSPDCADFYNPKTLASTMGSFARILPQYTDLNTYFTERKDLQVFGMILGGSPLEQCDLPDDAAYILGSESHGISDDLLPFVSKKIAITRFGGAESLNVAMATSILLYEIRN